MYVYKVVVICSNNDEEDCSEGKRETDLQSERAFRYNALTLAVLTVVFITITFVTIREQKGHLKCMLVCTCRLFFLLNV